MTGTTRSSTGLEIRQRKLLFRSWHRGLRELDLVLGTFADAVVGDLTEEEVEQYERLLEIPDTDLLSWIMGDRAMPAEHYSPLFERIVTFRREMTF
ncbi:MAG: succinate dehydrogenase assembly factor 2 [Hyphomicrobiales bacterium]|nr:succinate dehydrogenase assembly factor 2 [Hyphomicrobiales bacterium]